MSGGHFDYNQHKIEEIASSIEKYLEGERLSDEDVEYILSNPYNEYDYTKEELEYIKKNKHTIPNGRGYSEETIEEFKKGIECMRMAYIYAQRIDWLLSEDDGEEDFHKRLKKDLEMVKNS